MNFKNPLSSNLINPIFHWYHAVITILLVRILVTVHCGIYVLAAQFVHSYKGPNRGSVTSSILVTSRMPVKYLYNKHLQCSRYA